MRRSKYNFWIDPELRAGLRTIRERDGVLESEQIRRAIKDWLVKKGLPLERIASQRTRPQHKA